MTEIADRYRRLADQFARRIDAVPADAWERPTPCPEWSARDLVAHVADSEAMFLGFVDLPRPDGPSPQDDPAGAFAAARAAIAAGLDDPAVAGATFQGMGGETRFEDAVDRFLCFDLVVHGWDLAHATGQDETISPEDLARVADSARNMGDAMRGPGAFGPELDAPDGADEQTRLLAFLGRRA